MTNLTFNDDGELVLDFGTLRQYWREPNCPECGKPIQWVLDMMSFTSSFTGPSRLAHAECVWTPEAFDKAKKRAEEVQGNRPA